MSTFHCVLFYIVMICRTNILERYYNEEIRLTLPEGKRISRIKWFAIYDIGTQVKADNYVVLFNIGVRAKSSSLTNNDRLPFAFQNAFGDVYVPDEFEAPAPMTLAPLTAPPQVSSLPVKILDADTIL